MAERGEMDSQAENENNEKNTERDQKLWSTSQIKLLINVRLKYENEFTSRKRKKSTLWGIVMSDIKNVDPKFPFNKEEIHRKFLNLTITYKRIKKRNRESGRDATAWDFFNEFDEVYGTRHSVAPPPNMVMSSLDLGQTTLLEDTIHLYLSPKSSGSEYSEVGVPGSSSENSSGPSRAKKRRSTTKRSNREDHILEFLTNEAGEDKNRFEKLVEMEKQKIENDRDRIEVLRDIKNLLQSMLQ